MSVFDLCTPGVGVLVMAGSSESGGGTGIFTSPPPRKSFRPQKQHGFFFVKH